MTNALPEGKTYTVGYFNANKWPIHLQISELNVTLHLPPGKFVETSRGRKINDPYLEKYCGPNRLSREDSEQPIELVRLPKTVVERAKHDGHSVREVTEFTKEPGGVRRPVMPAPMQITRPTEDKNPVTQMTMAEARRLGLVRPTREVPDTAPSDNDGAPLLGERIPDITYASDSRSGVHQQGRVDIQPQQVEQRPVGTAVPPRRLANVKQPAQPAAAPVPPKIKEALTAKQPPPPVQQAAPLNEAEQEAAEVGKKLFPTPTFEEEEEGFGNEIVEMPSPVLQDDVPEPPVEEIVETISEAATDPDERPEENQQTPRETRSRPPVRRASSDAAQEEATPQRRRAVSLASSSVPDKNRFVCSVDQQPFRFRHQLERYARENFPDQYDEIMQPYPDA